jgi:hypothetical protein
MSKMGNSTILTCIVRNHHSLAIKLKVVTENLFKNYTWLGEGDKQRIKEWICRFTMGRHTAMIPNVDIKNMNTRIGTLELEHFFSFVQNLHTVPKRKVVCHGSRSRC